VGGGAAPVQELKGADIPWPPAASVSGCTASMGEAERKKRLRSALLRWHPDKFGRILGRVRAADRAAVLEAVGAVTKRILHEKRLHGSG
jgi:hypothetical protein